MLLQCLPVNIHYLCQHLSSINDFMPGLLVLAAILSYFLFRICDLVPVTVFCFSYKFIFFPSCYLCFTCVVLSCALTHLPFCSPFVSMPKHSLSPLLCLFHSLTQLPPPLLHSFYLTHTVIVKPWAQMLRSVPPPFSMWSCEKPREPSRMHRPCQAPASTQQ